MTPWASASSCCTTHGQGRSLPVNPFNLLELGFAPTSAPVKRAQASVVTTAPPERVWEVLLDHEHMSGWSPFKSSEIVSPGSGGGQVGTVRKLSGGAGRPESRRDHRRCGAALPDGRYVAEGAPLQWKYHGFVTLEHTSGGGTTITWEAQFRSPVPGSGMITSATLRSLAKGLAGAAEKAC